MQPVPITTKAVSSNPSDGDEYSIQLYVIKFVSDLQQVGGCLWVLQSPPPKKTYLNDISKILLKVVLNTTTLTPFRLIVVKRPEKLMHYFSISRGIPSGK